MPDLLIRDLPPELHQKLKDEAARNHRSLGRHALHLLESLLPDSPPQTQTTLEQPRREQRPDPRYL